MRHFDINGIPALLWGEKSDKVILYVHGKHGCKEEAERLAQIARKKGWQMLSVDLPGHGERTHDVEPLPWIAVPELQSVAAYIQDRWTSFVLCAVSLGAYLSMLAFADDPALEKSLFVSPLTDMNAMIGGMMAALGIDEDRLCREGEIETPFGETLSWRYREYALAHPTDIWPHKTSILCAERDDVVGRNTIEAFAEKNNAYLTVSAVGEHWFHTSEQLAVLDKWFEEEIDR